MSTKMYDQEDFESFLDAKMKLYEEFKDGLDDIRDIQLLNAMYSDVSYNQGDVFE